MSSNEPVVITSKQAKKQMNVFGWCLFIYSLFCGAIRYYDAWLPSVGDDLLLGYDAEEVVLIISIVGMLLLLAIPSWIARKKLDLDIKDYLKRPIVQFKKKFALVSMGISLQLIIISISMLFYFFFHTSTKELEYLGKFNTDINIIKNILYILLYVVIKPMVDETIFRGIVQRQLGHFGRYFGVIASSVLYALCQFNIVDGISCFFVGWYFALLTLRYHSIKPSIVIHACIAAFLYVIQIVPAEYSFIVSNVILVFYVISVIALFTKQVDLSMIKYRRMPSMLWKLLFTTSSTISLIVLFVFHVYQSFVA